MKGRYIVPRRNYSAEFPISETERNCFRCRADNVPC